MKAKIIKTGEIVDVYHEPQHGQITNIYKESVLVNGRMWTENELDFCIKTSEAPEKIYLQVCGDCNVNDCENCKFEDLEDNVTWCKDKIFDKDVEYTRTDVFIEKAFEFFGEHLCEYIDVKNANCDTFINIDGDKLEEDFRKYLKEE